MKYLAIPFVIVAFLSLAIAMFFTGDEETPEFL